MNLTEIGMRIKLVRKQAKLTQEALAEMIGVSPHYIYEIERGTKKMSLNVLEKLACNLNISTDYILFGNQLKLDSPMDNLDILINGLSSKDRQLVEKILVLLTPHLK